MRRRDVMAGWADIWTNEQMGSRGAQAVRVVAAAVVIIVVILAILVMLCGGMRWYASLDQ